MTPPDTCRCGAPLTQSPVGRRRRFCSEACRRKADRIRYGQQAKASRKRKTCKRPGCRNPLPTAGLGRPSEYCCKQCKRAKTTKIPQEERADISESMRQAVFARDGYRCLSCGSRAFLEADHIIAVHNDGPNWMLNYQALCRECNQRKGTRTIRYAGSPKI